MKTCFAFILLFLIAQASLAQTKSTAKKPITRVKSAAKPTPDLIGLLTVNPGIIRGTTSLTAIIDVIETKRVPTSGLITVYLHKDTSFINFKFDPAATLIENNTVHNANWTFDETTNPTYYMFTSTKAIAGGAISTIGLTGIVNARVTGKSGISMIILKGSGGEENGGNNSSSTAISYSP